ncbi:MAG: 50S ribosomal protein L11 methyltransferase [Acidilobaceae archaeon]|nr:50S ribosomal protein L11 methyltransferase [Acidilobaceae archaeon]
MFKRVWTPLGEITLRLHPCVYEPAEDTYLAMEALWRLKLMGRSYESIVDVGTGSGALALFAYMAFRPPLVLATDISPFAVSVARQNLPPEVHVVRCSGLCSTRGWELAILNPPYLPEKREEDGCSGWLSAAWAGEGAMEELVQEALSGASEVLLVYSSLSPFKPELEGIRRLRLASNKFFFEELYAELIWKG